jgi:hypothetical protein
MQETRRCGRSANPCRSRGSEGVCGTVLARDGLQKPKAHPVLCSPLLLHIPLIYNQHQRRPERVYRITGPLPNPTNMANCLHGLANEAVLVYDMPAVN